MQTTLVLQESSAQDENQARANFLQHQPALNEYSQAGNYRLLRSLRRRLRLMCNQVSLHCTECGERYPSFHIVLYLPTYYWNHEYRGWQGVDGTTDEL